MSASNVSHGEKDSSMQVSDRLLTARDVARLLGVSAGWVREHATRKQPRLPAVRLGRLHRFRQSDIEEFIELWCQLPQNK
jgi:excisionase family DNA binding protein